LGYITDLDEIVNRGVMITPALIVDGKTWMTCRVSSEHEISEMSKREQIDDLRARKT